MLTAPGGLARMPDGAAGATLGAVIGGLESHECLRQSRGIVEAWAQRSATTRDEVIAHTNHFTVVDRLGDPNGPMVHRL